MTEIRKYPNRRLYDTARSRYVNLDELAGMIRGGEDVRIVDAESGADLTREVLLQVVLDVLKATEFFPTGMLRRIIRASGDDPVNRLLRQQITAGLELLSAQMDQVETLFRTSPPPRPSPAPSAAPPPPEEKEPAADKELDALRKKLEELEKRLGR